MTEAERIQAMERATESLARALEGLHKLCESLTERVIALESSHDRD